ncbi:MULTISPECIES: PLP-dependent aminotransferase family protein [Clostridium]|jgi:2-aminoadipate transaminase|uniref:MocR-like pyridoxine biosynthesis transcription factor PdxR n=2 Tax=Clostridiaceae TaxID=31979 RepID=UPI000BE26C27|nr:MULTISPECIES: PLP-dependent aminotransferase family protein [Clostridium]MDB1933435.1 PLP-dependent aminotransferase family protein [Clostridium tertium]MDB1937417.1 PLP-dependent aminotransferase family protein [Clostridium tertium]MDB1968686.1 PLP-dependent aminotransferase family protein [Clostridium tertium]MDU2156934.1 PLP-dependent aminotransferase family protein [Clostridium sp.]MDU7364020.1 PLP-dependent aminotransferase family protein [Clostridium sp.]
MKEFFKISFEDEIPKYVQIANRIRKLIDNKDISDGEKLPTIRELADILEVNNVTIVNAYKKLKSDGYAFQKVGSGTYAKRKELTSLFNREYSKIFKNMLPEELEKIIDFTGETNTEVYFPINEFKSVINKVLDRDGANALIIKEPLGYEKLRETINKSFWNNKLDLDNILIVSGAQQGIDIASKAIVNINDNVIVEKPTYGGALSVFKWRRANIFEIEIKEDGVDLDEFEEILKKNKISCFYTMSYFQNPTGISYSREKKLKLLDLSKKYDFYIIEDDYLSELIYDNNIIHEPLKKLDKYERVIYIKSFSKIFLPGIRLGYMVTPASFNEIIQSSKINTDITTSSLMQRVLELYISEGFWKEHIAYQCREYKKKYKLIKSLIEDELLDKVTYIDPKGGLYFYIKLKYKSITSKELYYKLKRKNVFITPGVIFYRDSKNGDYFFRIGFSQVSKDKIIKGIGLIKEEL